MRQVSTTAVLLRTFHTQRSAESQKCMLALKSSITDNNPIQCRTQIDTLSKQLGTSWQYDIFHAITEANYFTDDPDSDHINATQKKLKLFFDNINTLDPQAFANVLTNTLRAINAPNPQARLLELCDNILERGVKPDASIMRLALLSLNTSALDKLKITLINHYFEVATEEAFATMPINYYHVTRPVISALLEKGYPMMTILQQAPLKELSRLFCEFNSRATTAKQLSQLYTQPEYQEAFKQNPSFARKCKALLHEAQTHLPYEKEHSPSQRLT